MKNLEMSTVGLSERAVRLEQRKNGAGSDRMTGVGQLLFDRIRFAGRKMYQPMIFGNSEAEG